MKLILIIGATIVTLALVSYSIAIIGEQRKRMITPLILTFLTIGISLDVIATCCMIIGSDNSPFTLHGILGYSSLTLMLIDTYLIWKFKLKNGYNVLVSSGIHLYSRIAYLWWVAAYITGSMLVILK